MKNYRIFLKIEGTLKGKRKAASQSVNVMDIEGVEKITPELVIEAEREAWARVDETLSKAKRNGALNFYAYDLIGEGETQIIRVELMPTKSTLVMR